ncbi:hypothetical protein [Streptococcus pluranimalium]|uniref:Uncharacterized protein n=1 Tax=Streptococcus pluranimalium TaxID=82348 RepID=A0A345VMR2_9STRE|nr:hypothetical protein [Streptococcus pluranimalium]AXJ14014.1 hypothetical protein Sp14A_21300 [Streptococcus pluranimalium]
MSKHNELLDREIEENIKEVRYVEPRKMNQKKPVFYVVVVCLVTLAVLLSLLRYL